MGVVWGKLLLLNIFFILVLVLFKVGVVVVRVVWFILIFLVIFVLLKDWSSIVILSKIIINIIIVIVGKINLEFLSLVWWVIIFFIFVSKLIVCLLISWSSSFICLIKYWIFLINLYLDIIFF